MNDLNISYCKYCKKETDNIEFCSRKCYLEYDKKDKSIISFEDLIKFLKEKRLATLTRKYIFNSIIFYTKFLDDQVSQDYKLTTGQRVYHLKNNLKIIPVCLFCGKILKYNGEKYSICCSLSCNRKISYNTLFDIIEINEFKKILSKIKNIGKSHYSIKQNLIYHTKYLDYQVNNNYIISPAQRIFHIFNDEVLIPKCICGKIRHFGNKKYHEFCSVKCLNTSEKYIMQTKNSKLLRYGNSKYNNREKFIDTMINKYGESFLYALPKQGKNEKFILDEIENILQYKIKRNYPVKQYYVDGYCQELNTVFEINEIFHDFQKEKDNIRQKNIEETLKCNFIIINDNSKEKLCLKE